MSSISTPPDRRHRSDNIHDSGRSERTADSVAFNKRMDLAAELEQVQNQLHLTEMQNRQLQSQLNRSSPAKDMWLDDSPSVRRVQKLERENGRLHDKLDDSAKKVSALERVLQVGELSLRDVQTKSHEELYDLLNSQEDSRKSLLTLYNGTVSELVEAKEHFDSLRHGKASLEVELRDTRSELKELQLAADHQGANRSQLLQEFADLQIRLDAESSRLADVTSNMSLFKSRSEEYFSKLEQAETAVLKATRAEQFAKAQLRETEETCAIVMSERKQMDATVEDLQRRTQQYEERIDDMAADLDGAIQAKKRLQHELEDYRSQRAMDVEDKEMSIEQARKKYQLEFSKLTNELEIERENVIHSRADNTRLREELEDLRSKWDDEVLNSSTWAKEKARLETTLQDLTVSREEAISAHNEAQSKLISLLSQVRSLRTSSDDLAAERDLLVKEKRGLETRLSEATDRLEELARGDSPSMRNAAGMDRDLLELKSKLAEKEDVADAAIGKMRRAEAMAMEMQKDVAAERDTNAALHREKAALEKTIKDLQGRVVGLETKSYSSPSKDVRFLNDRVRELESKLETQENDRSLTARSVRNADRTVRDLQSQIERRDRQNSQLSDDVAKSRDKVERLLATIDELQSDDSKHQLVAKRAERELREEREERLRLEREL